ncbi:DUF6226 family protein [Nocardioides montaniterrae]
MDDLLARVQAAFTVTGIDHPGWPDPHPDLAAPADEEYSRCLDATKYRILRARVDAWAQACTGLGITVADRPLAEGRLRLEGHGEVRRVRRFSAGGSPSLLVTEYVVGDLPVVNVHRTLDGGVGDLLASVPYCGCDACDDGSDALLDDLDQAMLTLAGDG